MKLGIEHAVVGLAGTASAAISLLLCRRCLHRCYRQPDEFGVRRTVVVTGAGSGLGRKVSEQLLARGDTVVALDISTDGLASLPTSSGRLVTVEANVAEWTSVEAAAAEAATKLRKLQGLGADATDLVDAIVNFAGIVRGGPMVEIKPGDVKVTMDVNVLGTVYVNRAFFGLMRRTGPGSAAKIVNVGSEISCCGVSPAMSAPYSMSKFAVEAYSTALRQEMAMLRDGRVSVVVMNPGAMKTPMVEDQKMGGANQFFERHSSIPGTLWMPALLAGAELATDYMRRNASDPKVVANVVEEIVHLRRPKQRYPVGVSLEMKVASFTPQVVLDAAVNLKFSNS